MEVAGRGTEIAMAQQDLNGSQVGAGLEQVGGETGRRVCTLTGLLRPAAAAASLQTFSTVRGLIGWSGLHPGKR